MVIAASACLVDGASAVMLMETFCVNVYCVMNGSVAAAGSMTIFPLVHVLCMMEGVP
jgi:hypothetical protein